MSDSSTIGLRNALKEIEKTARDAKRGDAEQMKLALRAIRYTVKTTLSNPIIMGESNGGA